MRLVPPCGDGSITARFFSLISRRDTPVYLVVHSRVAADSQGRYKSPWISICVCISVFPLFFAF